MFVTARLATVMWLAASASVKAMPFHGSSHGTLESTTLPTPHKRAIDLTFNMPSPSRICAAGASEDDPDTTVFVSPEDDRVESAVWERGQGELPAEEVEDLERWLLESPDDHITYLHQGNYANRWRAPGGTIEFLIYADRVLPIEVTQLVAGNWVNVLGNHRQVNDRAPAGQIILRRGNIRMELRPINDRVDGAVQPPHLVSDSDSDSDDDLEGVEVNQEEIERLERMNGTGMPLELEFAPNETPNNYFDHIGQIGGMPTYGSRSKRRRRTFGILRDIWNRIFGHLHPPSAEERPPHKAICGCQRVMKVVDLEAEVQRLELADLDLATFASDDPRDHERMDHYMTKLQGLSTAASVEEKARTIASLLRLSDEPPSYMVKELENEINACKGNTTLAKRKPPKGLASERWEDDRWNHQLSEHDVRELMADLQRNGLARVDPKFQSFRFGNAYVSWSSKFSDVNFAPPSREEVLPFVRMFLERVSWGEQPGGQWWKPWQPLYWSTSYRDIVFGQRTMRLCISNRPKRCLK